MIKRKSQQKSHSKLKISDNESQESESKSETKFTYKFRAKDFHPEVKGSWSAKRLELLQKKKHHRLKRTAMGEYIPAIDKPPLTSTAIPYPSAFDYHPTFEREGPKFTIGKKFRIWRKKPTPGPADYGELEDFYTSCKAPTMKSRAAFIDPPSKNKYKIADPATYMLPSSLSRNGAVIASRPADRNNVGMLPGYPHPPAGRDNIARFYDPMPTLVKGVKFGIRPKKLTRDEFPGPIYKVPPMFPEGIKFQFLKRLPWPPKINGWDAPAPNNYLPKSSLGKGGRYPRVSHRLPSIFQGNKLGPGPGRYAAYKLKLGVPKTMGQQPLSSRFPRQPVPAPNSYTVEPMLLPKESKTKHRAKYIKFAKSKYRVSGPKIIGRPNTMITLRHSAVENEPSPSIHLCYYKEEKFGAGTPGARIRSRPLEYEDSKIAPNQYNPCTDPKLKRIPAYTFGHKIMSKSVPLTLNVEPRPLPSTVELKNQFTFGVPLKQPESVIPSPTKYSLPSTFDSSKTQPSRGASLKSRQTPFVHHGIAKLKTPVIPTRMPDRLKSSPQNKINKLMNEI